MKYILTLITTDGLMLEETLDLPCEDTITWQDFMSLGAVKDLMLLHPSMTIIDVTPHGMPDWFSDEEQRQRQLANMGMKKTQVVGYAPEYQELGETE
jgi:hypothetical protein